MNEEEIIRMFATALERVMLRDSLTTKPVRGNLHVYGVKTANQNLERLIQAVIESRPEPKEGPEEVTLMNAKDLFPKEMTAKVDHSSVIKAIDALSDKISKLKLDPTFDVKAPNVTVEPASVTVEKTDLTEVHALLSDLKAAIVAIPKPIKPEPQKPLVKGLEEIRKAVMGIPVGATPERMPKDALGNIRTANVSSVPALNHEVDATYNYYALSSPGTSLAAAAWKVFRINITTGRIQHADGNELYDNVGQSLSGLTYA